MIFLTSLFKILDKTLSKEKVNLLTSGSVSSTHLNSEHLANVMRRSNRNYNIPNPPPPRKPPSDWIAPSSQNSVQMPYPVVQFCLPNAPPKEQSLLVPIVCNRGCVYLLYIYSKGLCRCKHGKKPQIGLLYKILHCYNLKYLSPLYFSYIPSKILHNF